MKKEYLALLFSVLYVSFLVSVIADYITLNSWQLVIVMGLGIWGTSYWGYLTSKIGETEEEKNE